MCQGLYVHHEIFVTPAQLRSYSPLLTESEIEAQRGQVSFPQQPSLKEAELAKPIVVCRAGCYTVPLRHPTLKYKWLKNGANSKPDTLPPKSGQSTILDP